MHNWGQVKNNPNYVCSLNFIFSIRLISFSKCFVGDLNNFKFAPKKKKKKQLYTIKKTES